MEDKELIMEVLCSERAWTICALDDETSWSEEEDRLYLARLNAEIARRIPQWARHTWAGKEMILMVEL